MASERVQKILARAGISSRRKAEELITEGLVTINGKVAKLGDKADMATDAIKVKGKLLLKIENRVYYAFHKPKGVISSLADPDGRTTIKDFLKHVNERVFPVGRLDFNSDGLILLTNDGDFAERLQRAPKVARVYEVKVKGHPTSDDLERLRAGTQSGRKHVEPFRVRLIGELQAKARIEVVFTDPGLIDIKTFFEDKGFLVERITRKAIGQITLYSRDGMLAAGGLRQLTSSQVEVLITHPELGLKRLDEDKELEKDKEKIEVKMFNGPRRSQRGGRKGYGPRTGSSVVIRLKGDTNSVTARGGARGPREEHEEGQDSEGGFGRAPRGPRIERGGFRSEGRAERSERGPRKSFGAPAGAPARPLGPKPFGKSKPRSERSESGFGKSEYGRYDAKPSTGFKSRSEGEKPRFGSDDRKSARKPSFGLTKKRTRD
ncbi:pseudouridine synthase [Bdellovibrionota bacterium FG-2]